jgi:predicted ATPase
VFFVDLSGLSDPGLVPGAVLHSLGLRAAPGRNPIEIFVTQLAEKDLLILLDNCEHLLDACASLADSLVRGCPRLWVLATSRERLGLMGEVVIPVEGLQLNSPANRGRMDLLMQSEAARLFIDRATRARPDFMIDNSSAEDIAQICEHLDGIPLAIELAAARAS